MDWDVKDCKLMADDGSGWQEAGNHLAVAVVMDAIRDERAACASLRSERDKLREALKDLVYATDHEDGVGIMLSVDRARAALGET